MSCPPSQSSRTLIASMWTIQMSFFQTVIYNYSETSRCCVRSVDLVYTKRSVLLMHSTTKSTMEFGQERLLLSVRECESNDKRRTPEAQDTGKSDTGYQSALPRTRLLTSLESREQALIESLIELKRKDFNESESFKGRHSLSADCALCCDCDNEWSFATFAKASQDRRGQDSSRVE